MAQALESRLEENLAEIKKEKYIGRYIGTYLNAKPKIICRYRRTLGFVDVENCTYIREMGLSFINTSLSKINFFPSKRKHASTKDFFKEKGVTRKIKEVFVPEYFVYKSPIYKPYTPKEINSKDFQGPFSQSNNPLIEKIIYKGKKIYFGIINKKLVIYSINYENGKKKMLLYASRKIDEEYNNIKFLKKIANEGLKKLIEIEKEKIRENNQRMKPAYYVNWQVF